MKKVLCFLVSLIGLTVPSMSQVTLTPFASGFTSPVDIKNCGDGRIFVLEQNGQINILDTAGNINPIPFLDIVGRVLYSGEQGCLGLAFPPDFATSQVFYVNYTRRPDGDTRISRFHVSATNPDSADANSEEILLTIHQPYSNHNGGHIQFGKDGYLYIGMGDGGSGGDPENRAQNPDSLLGKMLRIAVDPSNPTYSIPPTNPFAGNPSLGAEEIWALGVRNPWRWSFDRATGDLWIGDVGQGTYEEIDYEPYGSGGGLNYGWRCYEANASYNTAGCLAQSNYVSPVHFYPRSSGYSVTGGYVYRGARYADIYGKYFFSDYGISSIRTLEPDGAGGFTHTNLGSLGASAIVGFGEDKWGELYVAALGGTVYRLRSTACQPAATINAGSDTLYDCGTGSVTLNAPLGAGFQYSWAVDGIPWPSVTESATATQAGVWTVTVTDPNGCSNSDTTRVLFVQPPTVSFSGLDTLYCVYNSRVNLLPLPLGGTFTGPGIVGAAFDPGIAGIGTHTIVYTYTDNRGCTNSASQEVRVDACLGLQQAAGIGSLSVFPNPVRDLVGVELSAAREQDMTFTITDLTGRIVHSEMQRVTPGTSRYSIRAGKLAQGLYVLRVSNGISENQTTFGAAE